MPRRIALCWIAACVWLLPVAPAAAQQPQLHVVTYVDVYPNFAAECVKIMDDFAAASRQDPGSVRFEILRDVERQNHFAIIEVWQSRAFYEEHLGKAHNRAFREKLQPMLGSPFDERLYYQAP